MGTTFILLNPASVKYLKTIDSGTTVPVSTDPFTGSKAYGKQCKTLKQYK